MMAMLKRTLCAGLLLAGTIGFGTAQADPVWDTATDLFADDDDGKLTIFHEPPVLDAQGNFWIYQRSSSSVQYLARSQGASGNWDLLPTADPDHVPIMFVVTQTGEMHAISFETGSGYRIFEQIFANGQWSPVTLAFQTTQYMGLKDIAIDGDDNIVLSLDLGPSDAPALHTLARSAATGTWGTPQLVVPADALTLSERWTTSPTHSGLALFYTKTGGSARGVYVADWDPDTLTVGAPARVPGTTWMGINSRSASGPSFAPDGTLIFLGYMGLPGSEFGAYGFTRTERGWSRPVPLSPDPVQGAWSGSAPSYDADGNYLSVAAVYNQSGQQSLNIYRYVDGQWLATDKTLATSTSTMSGPGGAWLGTDSAIGALNDVQLPITLTNAWLDGDTWQAFAPPMISAETQVLDLIRHPSGAVLGVFHDNYVDDGPGTVVSFLRP